MGKLPKIAHQQFDNMDDIMAHAKEAEPEFAEQMARFLDLLNEDPALQGNVALTVGKMKLYNKARDNIRDKFDGDASMLCDVLRAKMVANVDVVKQVAEKAEEFFDIVAKEDRVANPNEFGYRDYKFNLQLSNGHVCELQCVIPEIAAVNDITHAARENSKAVKNQAGVEDRPLTEKEIGERDYWRKVALTEHNTIAVKGGLNDRLSEDLSDNDRLMLTVPAFPVVRFKAAASPKDPDPEMSLSVPLDGVLKLDRNKTPQETLII